MKYVVLGAVLLVLQGCALPPDSRSIGALKPTEQVQIEATDADISRARSAYLKTLLADRQHNQTAESLRRLGDLSLERLDQLPEPEEALEKELIAQAMGFYDQALVLSRDDKQRERIRYQKARVLEYAEDVERLIPALRDFLQTFPASEHYDQVAFRLAELEFLNRNYTDAAVEYLNVSVLGETNRYFENSIYKQGWALFKQDRFEEALDVFMSLLVRVETAGQNPYMHPEQHPVLPDTLRAINLTAERLEAGDTLSDWFAEHGERGFLADSYFALSGHLRSKGNYNDAADVLAAFISAYPEHQRAPEFQREIVMIFTAAGFPQQAVAARERYVAAYGSGAAYWNHHRVESRPEVRKVLRKYLLELAEYYHASAEAEDSLQQAAIYYRAFLEAFPDDPDANGQRFKLAGVLQQNAAFDEAASEYSRIAMSSSDDSLARRAAYAAVQALDEGLQTPDAAASTAGMLDKMVLAGQQLAHRFPDHERAGEVFRHLGGLLLENMRPVEAEKVLFRALGFRSLSEGDDQAETWLLLGDARLAQQHFEPSRQAYIEAEKRWAAQPEKFDQARERRLAALDAEAIQLREQGKIAQAVALYMRLVDLAPNSQRAPGALHDAATALIREKQWQQSVVLLQRFINAYPGHDMEPAVQLKLAASLEHTGELQGAANLYARLANVSTDVDAAKYILKAAALFEKTGYSSAAIDPLRVWLASRANGGAEELEVRYALARANEKLGDQEMAKGQYEALLDTVVSDPRSLTLRARANLALGEHWQQQYEQVFLLAPLKQNLKEKSARLSQSLTYYAAAADSRIAEVTTAATFKLAALNADFARVLLDSERPAGMGTDEQEEFELLLEEQAFPFEETAIRQHTLNLGRLVKGIQDPWISASLEQLKQLNPARFDKPMMAGSAITTLN